MEGKQMDTKRFAIATIVGVVTMFILDRVIIGWVFGAFYAANSSSIAGVNRSAVLYWALALASLAYTVLII
jgi:hypothetical protein